MVDGEISEGNKKGEGAAESNPVIDVLEMLRSSSANNEAASDNVSARSGAALPELHISNTHESSFINRNEKSPANSTKGSAKMEDGGGSAERNNSEEKGDAEQENGSNEKAEVIRKKALEDLQVKAKEIALSIHTNGNFGEGQDQKELREAFQRSRENGVDFSQMINDQLASLNSSLRLHAQITNLLKSNPPIEVWSLDLVDRANMRNRDNVELHYQDTRKHP